MFCVDSVALPTLVYNVFKRRFYHLLIVCIHELYYFCIHNLNIYELNIVDRFVDIETRPLNTIVKEMMLVNYKGLGYLYNGTISL